MRLRELTPILWTEKLIETTEYYTNVLGFKLDSLQEEFGFSHVHKDGVHLMLSTPQEQLPFEQPCFTGSFYIFVNGIDSLWEDLKDKANISFPIKNFDYGMREFGIFDINGYLIRFGQENNDD